MPSVSRSHTVAGLGGAKAYEAVLHLQDYSLSQYLLETITVALAFTSVRALDITLSGTTYTEKKICTTKPQTQLLIFQPTQSKQKGKFHDSSEKPKSV
ncbi:hypothetical protein PoB_005500800 [Plakobranchus ocellatus]|uniref:Uncharacterized protein n=1 Tax=Plakobranchus ocellatus TaxID=259542 RepID=A0AAV4CAH2_9GAST|nr:hypothetical protein PoB_005500800 [Plakobranchus ocellatus]